MTFTIPMITLWAGTSLALMVVVANWTKGKLTMSNKGTWLGLVILVPLLVGLGATPMLYEGWQGRQLLGRTEAALSDFRAWHQGRAEASGIDPADYQEPTDLTVGLDTETWIFQYVNDDNTHTAIYLGGQWLVVN